MIPKTITITHLGAETCVISACQLIRFQPDQGGRIVNHLKHGLDDPKADQQTLCDWVTSMPEPPGDIRLKTIQAIGKIDIQRSKC